ncbi:MAG: C4-type zinc ribbon domain-containing protein [Candidatus Omnitrophica bacterium]|nr:C4-type zinc ribbon domain-containing protein [Candidatus Omnitrophota bacterium]
MSTVSIQDQLKALLELQTLDAELYQLKRRKEAKPQEASALKEQQQQNAKAVQDLEQKFKGFEVKRKELELELEQKEGQIRKLQSQLFQCKTNKEYSAMQSEIEGAKADKSVLEEELIKRMDESDSLKKRQDEERAALKVKEEEIKKQLAQIDQEMQGLQKRIEELQQNRTSLTPKVDPQILARYEKILSKKDGIALVPVKGDACGGCNMILPPQQINEIMGGTRLIPCENCARILYIEPNAAS